MTASKEQVIAALENLHSCMKTTATILKRSKTFPQEHIVQLVGASKQVTSWIEGVRKGTK